jgi:hypothetical protein
MMFLLFLYSLALGGDLVVHAEVPAEIFVDGEPYAQLYRAGVVTLRIADGDRRVNVMVSGNTHPLTVKIAPRQTHVIVVGRTGITTSVEDLAIPEEGPATVEIRVVGNERLRLHIGEERYSLNPGDRQTITLPPGRHRTQLRSGNGTAIFATGELVVRRGGDLIIQITDGRGPEVIGDAGAWVSTAN